MFYLKRIQSVILAGIFTCFLSACGHQSSPNTLVVGTISGPETELMEVAQKVAQKEYGLNIKIVEFSDYNLPNAALEDGTLDANVYQHLPYLKSAMVSHGYHLEAIGKTFVYPTGIYSEKYKHLKQLPMHAIIAIPNDPSNEARALLLLQRAGLIRLKNSEGSTLASISSNPKQLRFKELDAAQLPRILQDVDATVINTNYAIPAGLSPSRDALFIESKHSPYANLIVIRQNSDKRPQLLQLVKSLNSSAVQSKAQQLFGDAAVPAW